MNKIVFIIICTFYANLNAQTINEQDFKNLIGKSCTVYNSQSINPKFKIDTNYWNLTNTIFFKNGIDKQFTNSVPDYACKTDTNFKSANFFIKEYSSIPYNWKHLNLDNNSLKLLGSCSDTIHNYTKDWIMLFKFPITNDSKWDSKADYLSNNSEISGSNAKYTILDSNKVFKSGTIKFNTVDGKTIEKSVLLIEHTQKMFVEQLGSKVLYSDDRNYIWITNNTNEGYLIIAEMRVDKSGVPALISIYSQLTQISTNLQSKNKLNYELFPNPTNNRISLNYYLKNNSDVVFKIFNERGKLIFVKNGGYQSLGTNYFSIDLSEFSSGNYVITISSNESENSKKFTLIK
jgi:hypothetical protein